MLSTEVTEQKIALFEQRKNSDTHRITMKNPKTGKVTIIKQYEFVLDYHAKTFLVETELEAYQAAYAYQFSKTKVKYSENLDMWMVTLFHDDVEGY